MTLFSSIKLLFYFTFTFSRLILLADTMRPLYKIFKYLRDKSYLALSVLVIMQLDVCEVGLCDELSVVRGMWGERVRGGGFVRRSRRPFTQ